MDPDQRDILSNTLGFSSTDNLGKYLGFPLKHVRTWKHDFDFVLDRVKKKLARWKANLLSMADWFSFMPPFRPFQIMLCNKLQS